MLLDNSELNAGILLDFLLEILGELLIAFGCDYRKRVDLEPAQPLALLVDAQPQASADRLPPLAFRAHFAKGANLKNVRIVPALLEGRVGEDELELRLKAQELLLVFHDQAVGALRVVPAGLVPSCHPRVCVQRRALSIEK